MKNRLLSFPGRTGARSTCSETGRYRLIDPSMSIVETLSAPDDGTVATGLRWWRCCCCCCCAGTGVVDGGDVCFDLRRALIGLRKDVFFL